MIGDVVTIDVADLASCFDASKVEFRRHSCDLGRADRFGPAEHGVAVVSFGGIDEQGAASGFGV